MVITLLLLLWKFLQIKFCITHDIGLINKLNFLCMLYIFSLGMNQYELYFATSSYDDTTS